MAKNLLNKKSKLVKALEKPRTKNEKLFRIASDALKNFQAKVAIDYFQEILKEEKTNQAVIYNLGCAYQYLGKYSMSLKWFSQNLRVSGYKVKEMTKQWL